MAAVDIKRWLSHPLTRGLAVDDPRTTEQRRKIIQTKRFLKLIYEEWYASIADAVPSGPGEVLEIGSGAGFLAEFIPGLITSEILLCRGVRVVLDGSRLPFHDGSLKAIVMTNVLHHLPAPREFFAEASRCIRPGGVIVMIEPWVSPWSRIVYRHLHHEPFMPDAKDWSVPVGGPLSGANGALPWILFKRDRTQFEAEFPTWEIGRVEGGMPFRYLVSGGVSLRSLMPHVTFSSWRSLERLLRPWMKAWAMFARITLVRRETRAASPSSRR
jgi:SAM-dependent methyltransferase